MLDLTQRKVTTLVKNGPSPSMLSTERSHVLSSESRLIDTNSQDTGGTPQELLRGLCLLCTYVQVNGDRWLISMD